MLIYYIQHNFTDWDSQTKHMSRIEKSIFLDLRSMYFGNASVSNGKVDASDFDMLCYRLSCNTDDEKSALKRVLKDKFKKIGNAYRLAKWDYVIRCLAKKYGNKGQPLDSDMTYNMTPHDDSMTAFDTMHDTPHDSDMTKSRQQKSNEKKKPIVDLLRSNGVKASLRLSFDALNTLLAENNLTLQHDGDMTQHDNSMTAFDGENRDITINQEPQTNNQDNKNTTTAGEFQNLQSVESVPVAPVTQFDIRTWDAPDYDDFLSVLMDNQVYIALSQDAYALEVEKFRAYNANQVAQGKPALADETYRMDKFVAWFKQLNNKQSSAMPATAYAPTSNQCADDDLPPIYHQASQQPATSYHPSHAKPAPKLDPVQSVMFNGVRKPLLPEMNQRQTYDHVMAHQRPGESSDETYDRLAKDIYSGAVA